MIRGFVAGSLALIVLYVVVQKGTGDKLATGGGVLSAGLNRLLSGDVAGMPRVKKATAAAPAADTIAAPMTATKPGMTWV